jgi:hypothetical protein
MSFGLKNAGATYQRAIQACLKDEIKDDLIEAYVDDIVVKTKEAHTLVDNLERTFAALNTSGAPLTRRHRGSRHAGGPPDRAH